MFKIKICHWTLSLSVGNSEMRKAQYFLKPSTDVQSQNVPLNTFTILPQTFYRRSKPKCSTKHFHDPLRVETTKVINQFELYWKKGEKIPTTLYARDEWQHVWWGYASVWPDRGNVDIETVEGGHIQTSGVAIDPSSSCTSSRRCSKESSLRK